MNYRELFERLANCNLPAGFEIIAHPNDTYGYAAVFSADRTTKAYPGYEDAPACRAALMLIVNAMRAEGWRFHLLDTATSGVYVALTRPTDKHTFMCNDPDEVTALMQLLIAALGVAG